MKTTRPQAVATVLLDTDKVIATQWSFAPGAETGWHRHGHDYVVVPITGGELMLEEPGGTERKVPLNLHQPYSRDEGVEHNVINPCNHPVAFIEIEIKKKG